MSSHHIVTSFAAAAVVGMSALSVGVAGHVSPPSHQSVSPRVPAPSACAGVARCHVVATIDVDGDGRADQVAWHQQSAQAVQIRVRVAPGKIVTAAVDVRLWWGGGAWGGASRVDGRAGAELLVGSAQGAHTPMYTMLTYRADKLVVEKSPSTLSTLWLVDAAYGDYIGWRRHTLAYGALAMTEKIAVRTDGTTRFTGHNETYAWTVNHWAHRATTPTAYPTISSASAIGGFQVAGLKAFPGLG